MTILPHMKCVGYPLGIASIYISRDSKTLAVSSNVIYYITIYTGVLYEYNYDTII